MILNSRIMSKSIIKPCRFCLNFIFNVYRYTQTNYVRNISYSFPSSVSNLIRLRHISKLLIGLLSFYGEKRLNRDIGQTEINSLNTGMLSHYTFMIREERVRFVYPGRECLRHVLSNYPFIVNDSYNQYGDFLKQSGGFVS